MKKRRALGSSCLVWLAVVVLSLVAINWRGLIGEFAGNVGLLILARSLSSADPLEPEAAGPDMTGREHARRWLQVATQIDTGNAGAWRGLGFALIAQGHDSAAIAAWQTAGDMAQEFIARGQALMQQDPQSALTWYEWASRIDPGSCPAKYFSGKALQSLGDIQGAARKFADCVQLNPLYLEAQVALCYTFIDSKHFHQALETYASVESSGQHNVSMLACAGTAHWQLGEYGGAASRFEEAVKLQPETASLHQWLSLTYARLGKYTEAIAASQTAIELNSSRPDYWRHLGNLYMRTNQFSAAKDAFEHVLALVPEDQQAKQSLAEIGKSLQ
jgi:tetratricopeptide (TPR) repeat protein